MKNIFIALILMYAACTITSCTKGGGLDTLTGPTYTVTGAADGTQMVPVVSVPAAATFSGFYDEQANGLTFTLAWTNIWTGTVKDAITSINFYAPAAAGANGTLIHTIIFSNANATGSVNLALAGNIQLLSSERDAMYAGKCYYIIFTQNYPAGIMRGQLTAAKH